jgi:hypothetical protein
MRWRRISGRKYDEGEIPKNMAAFDKSVAAAEEISAELICQGFSER